PSSATAPTPTPAPPRPPTPPASSKKSTTCASSKPEPRTAPSGRPPTPTEPHPGPCGPAPLPSTGRKGHALAGTGERPSYRGPATPHRSRGGAAPPTGRRTARERPSAAADPAPLFSGYGRTAGTAPARSGAAPRGRR